MLWVLNVVAYLINAIVVGGSQLGWFGRSNADVSDDNPTFVTPAGWAFSIWGIIFLSELVFVLWGTLPSNRNLPIIERGVGCWFAIACVVQAAWAVTFAQELLIVSAALLCAIAFSLAMAVVCLRAFKYEHRVLIWSVPFWVVHFPIGLHGGWTLAAALVNINVALDFGDVASETAALILTLVAAGVGASFAAVVFYDQVYLIAVVWAIAGISQKQGYRRERLGEPVSDGVDTALTGLWVSLLCVGVLGALAGLRKRNESADPEDRGYPSSAGEGGGRSDQLNALTRAIFSS